MSPETRYKIEELEKLTGLSRRLIYDYISRELVPPAMGSGKGAYYLEEHYERLRLISLLRTMGFRLERIEEALTSWSPEEIARIVEFAEGRDVESLDALNEWLTTPMREEELHTASDWAMLAELSAPEEEAASSEADAATSETASPRAEPKAEDALESLLFAEAPREARSAEARRFSSAEALDQLRQSITSNLASPPRDPEPSSPQTWHRIPIAPDIEISYRTDIEPEQRRRISELIARAKELFKT